LGGGDRVGDMLGEKMGDTGMGGRDSAIVGKSGIPSSQLAGGGKMASSGRGGGPDSCVGEKNPKRGCSARSGNCFWV